MINEKDNMKIIVIDDTSDVPAQLKKYADLTKTSLHPLLEAWQSHCQDKYLTTPSINQDIIFDIKSKIEHKSVKKIKKISYVKQRKLLPKFLR